MYLWGIHPITHKPWRFLSGAPISIEEMEERNQYWRDIKEKIAAEVYNKEFADDLPCTAA